MNKTKIIATIGPACESQKKLLEMMQAGMNLCRLNFSHGDYAWHRKAIENIRKAEKIFGKKIGIMADIQGPRIRVANKKPIDAKKGDRIFITDEKSPANHRYGKELVLDWDGFYFHVQRGDRILIEDGTIDLEVIKKDKHGCVAVVLTGGKIKENKGVNIPAISRHLGFLTDKDLADLEFVAGKEIDFVAASFVRSGRDIVHLRRIIESFLEKEKRKKDAHFKREMPWIISKIERKKAVRNIESIVEQSDGIMVARGDLAIEVSQEKLAIIQKDLIRKCLKSAKPVIVATQIMASMVENNRPTRAEISDISNAVIDQADAVMFSNETAVGKNPLGVVETAQRIIKQTEKSPYNDVKLRLVNVFAKLLFRQKKKKQGRKVIKAGSLADSLQFSSLRQEDVRISLGFNNVLDKRKASLIWGVE